MNVPPCKLLSIHSELEFYREVSLLFRTMYNQFMDSEKEYMIKLGSTDQLQIQAMKNLSSTNHCLYWLCYPEIVKETCRLSCNHSHDPKICPHQL